MLVSCISLYFSFMPIHYSIHWMYCYYGLFNMSTMKVTLKLVRRKRKKKSILLCFYHPRGVVVSKCKFVLSQISYASCSVGRVLQSPKSLSLPAYIPSLAFNKKHQAWLPLLDKAAWSSSITCDHSAPVIWVSLEAFGPVGNRCLLKPVEVNHVKLKSEGTLLSRLASELPAYCCGIVGLLASVWATFSCRFRQGMDTTCHSLVWSVDVQRYFPYGW